MNIRIAAGAFCILCGLAVAASAESQTAGVAGQDVVDSTKPPAEAAHSRRIELRKALKQQPPWGSNTGVSRQLTEKDRAELRQQLRAQRYDGK